MGIFDTDHFTFLIRNNSMERKNLLIRLADLDRDETATTIITYEEQTRGWFSKLSQARSQDQICRTYDRLNTHLHNYCSTKVLHFDSRAGEIFQQLRLMRLKVGTMDLKIASIVLNHDAPLLTRNIVDFKKVPGLKFEDWSM